MMNLETVGATKELQVFFSTFPARETDCKLCGMRFQFEPLEHYCEIQGACLTPAYCSPCIEAWRFGEVSK